MAPLSIACLHGQAHEPAMPVFGASHIGDVLDLRSAISSPKLSSPFS